MRIFEVKPCGSVTLEKLFVRNKEAQVSSVTVTMTIFPLEDETEYATVPELYPSFNYDDALLVRADCTYVESTGKYTYDLTTNDTWHLGMYLAVWEATIDNAAVTEYDKLYVVAVTRQDMVNQLDMPSSVNAGGITLNYSQRLHDMKTQRGVRVGRIHKNRRASRNDGDRDYGR